MQATLNIQIFSTRQSCREDILFFNAVDWCEETEQKFLEKIQEVFRLGRRIGSSFEVMINFETDQMNEASFILNKKNTATTIVHTQKLSIREIEVLGLIMNGLTNNEIAEKLFISYETVKSHRKKILEKTGSKNTASLINHYHNTFFEK